MQEVSRREFLEIAGKLREDFAGKVKVKEEEDLPPPEKDGGDEVEEEFSFVIASADGSPISADDIFEGGRIRPVFPFFGRDLLFSGEDCSGVSGSGALRPPLKKVFLEEREEEDEGPYCEWQGNAPPRVVEASPGICKKSNSTGLSKLRRFREFVSRSNSDGKDAFVFLHNNDDNNNNNNNTDNNNNKKVEKQGKKKGKEAASFQVYYGRNKATKEGDKRKSYLPYRRDLVGFFANANGLSRNVHPF